MDIWLINHYAVPPKYYPLARQTYFAKYLMQMGHTVKIFAASTVHNSDINLIKGKETYKEEIVDGVSYVYIKCRNYNGNGLKRIYNICEFAWKLPKVCKRFKKPDAIVATSMPPTSCAMGIRLAMKYKCKGIAEIADLWPESIVAYGIAGKNNPAVLLLRKLEKWIYNRADKIVFTMEGAYDYIVEQGWEKEIPREKVYYINNGVDLQSFKENLYEYRIDDLDLTNPDLFKVVYTGSVRKVNNLDILIEAAKEIRDPKIRILVWGNGDELQALKNKVERENIKNIVFKGYVDKKFVPYIVSNADINIAHNTPTPLFRFGISLNKMFEYLAAGKPILFDFCCPYNPVIKYEAGIEIDGTVAKRIANAIEMFASLDNEDYRKYQENAFKAACIYDFQNLTKKLYDVISI